MNQQERHDQGLRKLQEIAGDRAANPLSDWNEIAPDMRGYIVDFIAGDILSRPGLDAKTRQLATVAMLAAFGHAPDEFKMHLGGAVRLGWTREQLVEVLLQTAVFAGFPASLNALKAAANVFAQNPRPNADGLVEKIQAADAALDVDAFVSLLTPGVVMQIGSQPELHGHESVRLAIAGLFSRMRSIQHRTIQQWHQGDQILLRAEVTFDTKQDQRVTLPYFNVLRLAPGDLVAEYRIHIDLQPLAPAALSAGRI